LRKDSISALSGSPPRRWGILSQTLAPRVGGRFTPTQVGNTACAAPRLDNIPVHPHAGGEYYKTGLVHGKSLGSPPRRWGILSGLWLYLQRRRFTPTQVGNTNQVPCSATDTAVHPHAGGEYACNDDYSDFVNGSPPRRWGIRRVRFDGGGFGRFTPTQVGNTNRPSPIAVWQSVHPHAGGEYLQSGQ